MQFSTIIATVLSFALLASAAPVAVNEARQEGNHGMCVSSVNGQVSEIVGC
ncbi:hypothetical protein K505DRAFT_368327 [Melanomma pulvis-pyrius CBS 109.77]|uniref:Uncharacterized protein n=1 Tax=Melanomma pulvis-pyrius CBS 109.77 TaxID=1314802 RepID=A0A6A6WR02_9PLEO|nr:hypothetical protein K505DRAFT_368327 [Melanomma pulvis-pyrius CBS 109.77]